MWFKQAESERSARPGSPNRTGAPSILSDDLKIEGDIVSEGEVHISGSVKGDVTAQKLTLGEQGSITGTVDVEVAVIAGHLAGRLTATSVLLASSARVVADITHVSLSIEPGAVFEGFSRRVDTIESADSEDAVRAPRLSAPTVQPQPA
jgi:cytoskeletal protein CcmA (bactofilin family)